MKEILSGTVTARDWAAVAAILGAAALIVAGYFFVIQKSQNEELAVLEAEYQQKQEDYRRAKETEEGIEDLRRDTALIKKLVEDFNERLPSESEIRSLVSTIEKLAREVNLEVEVSPKNKIDEGNKVTYPYTVVAYGDFHEITGFVNRLEAAERYLKVSDLEIGEEKSGVAEAKFTLSTYQFVEAPRAAGSAS